MGGLQLVVEALTADAFAPFGDVIEARDGVRHHPINAGYAERFHDLGRVDVAAEGGRVLLNIFRAKPRAFPVHIDLVERHRLGSQAFVPMAGQRFLVVVAQPGPAPGAAQLRCFMAAPGQGVNCARGTWHSPLLAIDAGGDFLVVDRGGPGAAADCDVHPLPDGGAWITL